MPIYQYEAVNEEGHTIKGKLDVANESALQKSLEGRGYFLVAFTPETSSALTQDILGKYLPIPKRSLYLVTLQLANTIDAGLPLLKSLRTIAGDARNKRIAAILKTITDDLSSGSSFSEALRRHPKIFSRFYTSMIELGESSGNLPQILNTLANYINSQMKIQRRVTAALTYPLILTLVGTGIVFYIMTGIMPEFIKIFNESKVPLPAPTRFLIATSYFMQNYWYIILIAFVGVIVLYKVLTMNPAGRMVADRIKLRLPVLGNLVNKICGKRFIDSLFMLYSGGIPILSALSIIKSVMRNAEIESIIETLGTNISQGGEMASYLSTTNFFPPDILALIRTGEESGNLQQILGKISKILEEEIDYAIDKLISLFEILVIIVMGVGVGFVALSVMYPMFKMSDLISK